MNKKKLSRSGSLQSSVTSVLAALLCILIGLLVGFLVLVAINPAHAWGDGFVRIIKGGFHDAPYGVGKELANAAPLIMTGLSVAFAFKTGLFNIGAAEDRARRRHRRGHHSRFPRRREDADDLAPVPLYPQRDRDDDRKGHRGGH